MHIQGDLQLVFDALYQMGVIEPLLQKDWADKFHNIPKQDERFQSAIRTVNESHGSVREMISKLSDFDQQTLEYLAMEVAREFADYSTRQSVQ
ncbi:MAG TPA: cytochrome [Bdellovibrionales bacterium]|nr:cytochrome [Bdellovibrionales bacterium]